MDLLKLNMFGIVGFREVIGASNRMMPIKGGNLRTNQNSGVRTSFQVIIH